LFCQTITNVLSPWKPIQQSNSGSSEKCKSQTSDDNPFAALAQDKDDDDATAEVLPVDEIVDHHVPEDPTMISLPSIITAHSHESGDDQHGLDDVELNKEEKVTNDESHQPSDKKGFHQPKFK